MLGLIMLRSRPLELILRWSAAGRRLRGLVNRWMDQRRLVSRDVARDLVGRRMDLRELVIRPLDYVID